MTRTILAILVSIVACVGTAPAAPSAGPVPADPAVGQRVPPFTAQVITPTEAKPKTVAFDSQKAKRITVYIFVGTTCPATAAYAERLKQLEQTYGRKGADFVYLYPNRNDTSDAKLAFHKQQQFTGRMIDDQGGRVAHLFKAQRTSELFLADKKGTIVYHGAVDDSRDPSAVKQRYLAAALDELLAGKPIVTAASQVFA